MSAWNTSRIWSPTRSEQADQVELPRDRLADVVDGGELGRPLIGFRQEPLRLIEQPGVLEGDRQARAESREQPDVGIGEGVLAIEVLERDDAPRLIADDERHAEADFGSSPWIACSVPALRPALRMSSVTSRGSRVSRTCRGSR